MSDVQEAKVGAAPTLFAALRKEVRRLDQCLLRTQGARGPTGINENVGETHAACGFAAFTNLPIASIDIRDPAFERVDAVLQLVLPVDIEKIGGEQAVERLAVTALDGSHPGMFSSDCIARGWRVRERIMREGNEQYGSFHQGVFQRRQTTNEHGLQIVNVKPFRLTKNSGGSEKHGDGTNSPTDR